jgi:hypothetical protein
MGSRISLALHVAIEKGIADILENGPKYPDEISSQTHIPTKTLTRLLCALSDVGVFRENSDGGFSNTAMSNLLRSDVGSSLRDMSLVLNHHAVLAGWQQLERVLETGAPAFPAVNGQTFFEHLASDPKRVDAMARFMRTTCGMEGPRIAAGFPFGRFRRLIDIGGAGGHILADILKVHPGVEGAVFDVPQTAKLARRFLADQGLAERCSIFSGDFLQSVPAGYDAYFIKSTLHDWDDNQSVQILSNIGNAMPAHGRVLVVEIVLEKGKSIAPPHRFIDLEMMVTFGGKERTAEEFRDLMNNAGLRLEQVWPIEGSVFSVIEGSRT